MYVRFVVPEYPPIPECNGRHHLPARTSNGKMPTKVIASDDVGALILGALIHFWLELTKKANVTYDGWGNCWKASIYIP